MANGDRLWYVSHDFNNRRLKEVHDPVEETDAANKRYVDAAVAGGGGAAYLGDLADVDVQEFPPAEGYSLRWYPEAGRASGGRWVAAPQAAGVAVSDLTDVDTTGAVDGQVLALSGDVWVPVTPSTDTDWLAAGTSDGVVRIPSVGQDSYLVLGGTSGSAEMGNSSYEAVLRRNNTRLFFTNRGKNFASYEWQDSGTASGALARAKFGGSFSKDKGVTVEDYHATGVYIAGHNGSPTKDSFRTAITKDGVAFRDIANAPTNSAALTLGTGGVDSASLLINNQKIVVEKAPGTEGQVLTTDADGAAVWADPPAGGGGGELTFPITKPAADASVPVIVGENAYGTVSLLAGADQYGSPAFQFFIDDMSVAYMGMYGLSIPAISSVDSIKFAPSHYGTIQMELATDNNEHGKSVLRWSVDYGSNWTTLTVDDGGALTINDKKILVEGDVPSGGGGGATDWTAAGPVVNAVGTADEKAKFSVQADGAANPSWHVYSEGYQTIMGWSGSDTAPMYQVTMGRMENGDTFAVNGANIRTQMALELQTREDWSIHKLEATTTGVNLDGSPILTQAAVQSLVDELQVLRDEVAALRARIG